MDTPLLAFWAVIPGTTLTQALWLTCIWFSPWHPSPFSTGTPLFGRQLFSH